jgi:hypothetical protein
MRVTWPLLVCLALGCVSRPPSDARLREVFTRNQAVFEKLRDQLVADTSLDDVRLDSYSWTDPCVSPECGPPVRRHGLPPGERSEPCDWKDGCSRWRDGKPSPEAIAAIGHIPVRRAQSYLDGLQTLGAIGVFRGGTGTIEFWMHLSGIVTSGRTKSIVWCEHPPADLVADTDGFTGGHGDAWARLAPGWFIENQWN